MFLVRRSLGTVGVRFERAVKGTPAEAHLAALRTRFKPATGFGVLDGLQLQQEGPGTITEPEALVAAEGTVPGADALTAEAVYQIVKGHPENALAELERIAKGEEPPALTVTEVRRPACASRSRGGAGPAAPPGPPRGGRRFARRARPRNRCSTWCGLMLGPADAVTLTVDHDGGALPVPLRSLGIAAIDVVLAGRDGGPRVERARCALCGWDSWTRVCARIGNSSYHRSRNALAAVITPCRADAFGVPSALPLRAGRGGRPPAGGACSKRKRS